MGLLSSFHFCQCSIEELGSVLNLMETRRVKYGLTNQWKVYVVTIYSFNDESIYLSVA